MILAYQSQYTGQQIDESVGSVIQNKETWTNKQDKLTGTEGQVVGFNGSGEAISQALPIASAEKAGVVKIGTGVSVTEDGTISVTGGSGGTTYTAGDGIKIESDEISVDSDYFSSNPGTLPYLPLDGGTMTGPITINGVFAKAKENKDAIQVVDQNIGLDSSSFAVLLNGTASNTNFSFRTNRTPSDSTDSDNTTNAVRLGIATDRSNSVVLDMGGMPVVNMGEPTKSHDAVTLKYFNEHSGGTSGPTYTAGDGISISEGNVISTNNEYLNNNYLPLSGGTLTGDIKHSGEEFRVTAGGDDAKTAYSQTVMRADTGKVTIIAQNKAKSNNKQFEIIGDNYKSTGNDGNIRIYNDSSRSGVPVLDVSNSQIINVRNPSNPQDAVTLGYIQSNIGTNGPFLPINGGTMGGPIRRYGEFAVTTENNPVITIDKRPTTEGNGAFGAVIHGFSGSKQFSISTSRTPSDSTNTSTASERLRVGIASDRSNAVVIDAGGMNIVNVAEPKMGLDVTTKNYVDNAITDSKYTLPIASADTLGGIRVGQNLTITPEGVLNATGGGSGTIEYEAGEGIQISGTTIQIDKSVVPTKSDLSAGTGLPVATKEAKGIAQVGSGLNVDAGVISVDTSTIATKESVDNIINGTTTITVSVPDATTSSKGIIQVGSGLNVNDGTVSVDTDTIATKESVTQLTTTVNNIVDGTTPITVADATKSSKGIVQIGAGLNVEAGTVSLDTTAVATPSAVDEKIEQNNTELDTKYLPVQTGTTGQYLGFTAENTVGAVNAPTVEIPVATTSKLGGVIPGNGLSVDVSGNLTVNEDVIATATEVEALGTEIDEIVSGTTTLPYLKTSGGTMTGAIHINTPESGMRIIETLNSGILTNETNDIVISSTGGIGGPGVRVSSQEIASGGNKSQLTIARKTGESSTYKASFGGMQVSDVATPTENTDVATKQYVDNAVSGVSYTLPQATTDTLGGVKVGSGLSVSEGTVSVNTEEIASKSSVNDIVSGTTALPYLKTSGGIVSGAIAMSNNKINDVSDGTQPTDAATYGQVTAVSESVTNITNGTTVLPYLKTTGGTMTGAIAMGNQKITGLGAPSATTDASTKQYVDTQVATRQSTIANATCTLTTAGWSGNSQTVTCTGVTASNDVIVSPAPASWTVSAAAGVYCTAQAANQLTFACSTVPTANITVNVLIIN